MITERNLFTPAPGNVAGRIYRVPLPSEEEIEANERRFQFWTSFWPFTIAGVGIVGAVAAITFIVQVIWG
jgi:hypothetical protein